MQISATELKAKLVSFAREIGFDSCRVTACNAPAHANHFSEWLRDGAHGEMNYMQRGEEKRCDPENILPGARSIVVLALNYFQGEAPHRAAATGITGRIARYAWGEDYHDVIGTKLNTDRRVSSQLWRRAEMLCRHRACAGTGSCRTGWRWLAWQEHHAYR